MNFQAIPIKNPHTYASHFGTGSEHGKPYYNLGQECEKLHVPRGNPRSPLSLSGTKHRQTRLNDCRNERLLHAFGDPPTHRSCVASYNKDGGLMDSQSHYSKIGSKHMCNPRADHPSAVARSQSMPQIHPWESRRKQFRDPTPWHFNAAFSTSSDGIGKFYSSHLIKDQLLLSRTRFDWVDSKTKLMDGDRKPKK